jgi:very-short-patch-repair endonuclease
MPRQAPLLESEWPELAEALEPRKSSGPEDYFASQCTNYKLPYFERQLRFAKALGRQWRFDFAFPDHRVAVEIDGVAVRRVGGQLVVLGRHASIQGIRGDYEKLNTAAMLGWTCLRFLQTDVKPKIAIEMTMRVLTAKGWRNDRRAD